MPDALAFLELSAISRGYLTLDAMVKRASVEIARAETTSPGRYLIQVSGGVAEVEEAYWIGKRVAAEALLDALFLPGPHPSLLARLGGEEGAPPGPSAALGVIECYTSASAVAAADAALKTAEIEIPKIELGSGLGGKGWFMLYGAQHDLEAATCAARAAVTEGMLLGSESLHAPHPDLLSQL